MRIVVKIGTSSLTDKAGDVDVKAIEKLCREVAAAKSVGREVIVVTSGAITAGLPRLGYVGNRPRDVTTLQAAAAVGQGRLLKTYEDAFAPLGLVAGQILLSPRDFLERSQYLQARATVEKLLEFGVVPIINENDAVSDDEIRWGDNDRLAALVAHALNADLLVLLTDTAGVFTADPNIVEGASLVEEIVEIDHHLSGATGPTTSKGSGGMASKLLAARMASRSGVRAVIAASRRDNVLADAIEGSSDVGTIVRPQPRRMPARKLWIAYALQTKATVVVDNGAKKALIEHNKSLLPAGVVSVSGDFQRDDGVEVADTSGQVLAKGISRMTKDDALARHAGELIHRDDLVLLV